MTSARLRRVWIFSDLHLTCLDSPFGRSFLRTLDEPARSGDAVILAGDIFELLIGSSIRFQNRFAPFFQKIEALIARGVRVDYIEGNHDFHLRGLFPDAVRIHGDAVDLDVRGASGATLRIRIEHGDLVDREDRAYLKMRALFRSPFAQKLVAALPGSAIEAAGALLARSVDQKNADLPETMPEADRSRLRSKFRNHAQALHHQGADFVVLGHCHDLDEWGGFYWNMGYPPAHRQFLYYEAGPDGSKDSIKRRNFLGI